MWKGAVTNVGVALLKKWAAGGTMSITGAKGASGFVEEAQLTGQADLTNIMQTLSITGYSAQGSGIAYRVQVLAAGAEYTLRQIGIYGKLDGGSETLIAIYQDAGGMTVPALSVAPDFVFEFTATVQMSNEPYQITYASVKIEVLLTNACVIHLYVLCMDIQRGATGGL